MVLCGEKKLRHDLNNCESCLMLYATNELIVSELFEVVALAASCARVRVATVHPVDEAIDLC